MFTAFRPPHFTDLNGQTTWKASDETAKVSPYRQWPSRASLNCGDRLASLDSATLTPLVGPQNAWQYTGPRVNATDQEHVDLVRAIRSGQPHNEGYYGANSSFTAVLGRMATYSGSVVNWDEAVVKGPDEMPKQRAWDADPPVLPDAEGSYEHTVAVPRVDKAY